MSQSRDVIEQKQGPNQIVRIRSDSETNLDDLFKAVMQPKGNQAHQSVPMRMRNLPPSFFQQPERGSKSASHSRESSTDNTFSSPPPPSITANSNNNISSTTTNQNSVAPVNSPPPPHPSGLPINHPRAHSSPASLQQTYNASQHQHLRQQSYDITDSLPLPPGWEKAKTATGQTYFLNHTTQTTTWEDPRKKLSTGSLSSSSGVTCSSPSTSPASSILNLQNLGNLPDGWEQATTPEGEVYFINHKNRTTSWYDPRIPIHLQQPPVVPILGHSCVSSRLQNTISLATQQSQNSSVTASIGAISLPSLTTQTLQQQQQKLRLQRLQIERERLRMRQEEILRETNYFGNPLLNEIMVRQTLREETSLPTSPSTTTSDPASITNIDPFLSGDSDFHSRQESGDSGLGLSTNYSLPNTPEDYLMGVDEGVEGSSADDVLLDIADLNLEPIPGVNLDIVPENMDSEDLVPSLHEELNADVLSDVEAILNSNKESVMKWL